MLFDEQNDLNSCEYLNVSSNSKPKWLQELVYLMVFRYWTFCFLQQWRSRSFNFFRFFLNRLLSQDARYCQRC